jgi:predicted permease
MTGQCPRPPSRVALWLIERSLPARDREEALGDVREEYARLARHDAVPARRWLRRQALRSLTAIPQRLLPAAPPSSARVSRGRQVVRGLMGDLVFGHRLLRHQPLTAFAGLLSLAIGLGLNLLLFTLTNAILLTPLPLAGADRLVMVQMQRQDGIAMDFSYPFYQHLRTGSPNVFDTLVAYSSTTATARVAGPSEPLVGEYVSGNFFIDLAVPMAMGRGLTAADDTPDAPPTVVLSQARYRRYFGDVPLSGQQITLNRTAFTIVGVADRRFFGTEIGETADFWVAIGQMYAFEQEDYRNRPTVSWLALMGRLAPGVTRGAAQARLSPAATSFFDPLSYPPQTLLLADGWQGDSDLPRNVGRELRLLMAASLFLLLIACINVTNLQLARVGARRHELAVRAALGAGRARLALLIVADAIVVTVPAGLIALAAAALWKERAARLIAIWGQPVALALPVDAAVAGAALALTVASAGLIGGLSAALSLRRSPALLLAEGGRAHIGAASRSQRALVIVQFALSMTLAAGAALLVRSVDHLRDADMGFSRNIALIDVALGPAGYTGEMLPQYYQRAFDLVSRVPGVEGAAIAHVMPLDFGGSRQTIEIEGYVPADGEDMELNTVRVSPGYFNVMRLPVIAGREFTTGDTAGQPRRIIVNETMARRYWPNAQAVGRFARFYAPKPAGPRRFDVEIVGVVADARYRMVREDPRPTFYVSTSQQPISFFVLHVRTSGRPDARLGEIERAVANLDPNVPVRRAITLESQLDRNIADERMARSLALALGLAALVLAGTGLYATMAFAVRRRTREIGVRMALGADAGKVRMMVVRQGLALVVIGVTVGLTGALWTGRALQSQLYGVSPIDPISLIASAAVLAAAGLAASWLPARRATRINPVTALHDP